MEPEQEPADSGEDPVEEVEHRLRVQELLQFANSNLLQAYTTKHGLQKHMKEYHRATEAVQNNRCEDLLQLAEVQQFLATRIELEREQAPSSPSLPPDMMMSLAEQIEPLLWNGHVKLLYKKRQVRFSLTTSCQLCGQRFGTAAQLHLHLHEQHAAILQETLHIKELLQWALFMDLGCFCNPSCGWGEALHDCVSLSQLAMVAVDYNWQLILPWTFSSVELSAVLEPLLPLQTLQKVTMALMTRNFHQIWDDSTLQKMLCNNCLFCQEEIPFDRLLAHLVAIHGQTDDRLRFLTYQLCAVFAQQMTAGGQCEWCGTVLPCRLEGDDLIEYPEEHLVRCPLVIQFAILLMIPVWSKPSLQPLIWPTHEAIAAAQRQEELKLWQFNVFAEQLRRTMTEAGDQIPMVQTERNPMLTSRW